MLSSGTSIGITVAAGTAFTVTGGTSSTIALGTGITTGSITVGAALTTGSVTVGNTASTSSTVIQSGTGGVSFGTGSGTKGLITAIPATASTASATVTVTLNSNLLNTTWTGFTTASAGTQDFTIVSSKILTTSCILVTIANLNASGNDARMGYLGITQSAGQIIVHTKNNGAGALGAGDNVLINVWVLS